MFKNALSIALLGSSLATAPAVAADQHLIIVSIGDSLAAGEGNPNSFNGVSASWSSAPCHRSQNNGRRFASNRINNLDGVTTQFADFSCSGAKIDEGLLGTQLTSQPNVNNTLMPPQIDQAANFQHNVLHDAPIDILEISVGVNDVNFASVVTDCLIPGNCASSSSVQTALNVLNGSSFPNAYDRLGAAIRQKLNVRKVYITEYPVPVTSAPGNLCGSNPADAGDVSMVGESSADNQFLINNVLGPLNDKVQQAAGRNSWTFVRGPEDTFATHGYCTVSARRYVNTLQDSLFRQGDANGTIHPNVAGHEAYADALIAQTTRDFNLDMEKPRVLRTVEANTVLPGPIADSGPKVITVEVGQHPGTLTAVLQHRVVTPALPPFTPQTVSAWVNTNMADSGAGRLNLFAAQLPGFIPGQTAQYRVVITGTRNGDSVSKTTSIASIAAGDFLVQQ